MKLHATRCRQFFPSQGQEGKGGDTLWARGIVPTLSDRNFHAPAEMPGDESSRENGKKK